MFAGDGFQGNAEYPIMDKETINSLWLFHSNKRALMIHMRSVANSLSVVI